MIVTIILGIVSVLFSYLAKYKNVRWGLKVSFALIFFYLALRYNFGNDYEHYFDNFYGFSDLVTYEQEPGWPFLCTLFRPFGFFSLIAVLALFNCIIYYRFIKKYVPERFYWLAVFMYIFNPSFMLIHSSAMRQSVAIMLFVFSIDFLVNKKAIRYFICVGLASLFHISAILLLPIYFVTLVDWQFSKAKGAIVIAIYSSIFLFSASIRPIISQLAGSILEHYLSYSDAGVVRSGLGFLYIAMMLCILIYFEKRQNMEISVVFKLAIIGLMLQPITLAIEMFSRLLMYFGPATLCAYPHVSKSIEKPKNRIAYISILVVFSLYLFFQFFYSDTYRDYFGVYHTIISAPQW